MKIALYIAEGHEQVVLTPETDYEKSLLERFHNGSQKMSVFKGSFYTCQGGWTRHGVNDESTILVFRGPVTEGEKEPAE